MDPLRGFPWREGAGIQLDVRAQGRKLEGSGVPQLPVFLHGAQLSEGGARRLRETALELGLGAAKGCEEDPAALGSDRGLSGVRKLRANRPLRCEGEDERDIGPCGLAEDGQPELLAQVDEGRAPELEDRLQEIDCEVVVEETEAGERLQLSGNRQLARAGRSVEEQQPHSAFPLVTRGGRATSGPGVRSKTATPSGTWWKLCLSMVKITI